MSCRLDAADTDGPGLLTERVPYLLVFKRYWRPLIGTGGVWYGQFSNIISPRFNLLRFIYDFVAFPNGIFSGTIISSVVHDGDIRKIAEWQLLLASITLPGVFIGAFLCNYLGRRHTVGPLLNQAYLDQNSPLVDPRVHWLHNYR
jgi:hypothetical protein